MLTILVPSVEFLASSTSSSSFLFFCFFSKSFESLKGDNICCSSACVSSYLFSPCPIWTAPVIDILFPSSANDSVSEAVLFRELPPDHPSEWV